MTTVFRDREDVGLSLIDRLEEDAREYPQDHPKVFLAAIMAGRNSQAYDKALWDEANASVEYLLNSGEIEIGEEEEQEEDGRGWGRNRHLYADYDA